MQHFCYLFLWLVTLTASSLFLNARFSFLQLWFQAEALGFEVFSGF